MVEAGEVDVARDELRWLLEGCTDCLAAHKMLGELALMEEDLPLARGHFGYAYRIGQKALEAANREARLPYAIPANQGFHEAGKGLVYCLCKLGKADLATEIAEQLVRHDPSDPLAVRELLTQFTQPPSCSNDGLFQIDLPRKEGEQ